jgi:LCP family protein required for cell wall assembly
MSARRAHSAKARRKEARRPHRRRRWVDRVLLALVVVVAAALVAVAGTDYYVTYRFNQVTKVSVTHLKVVPVGLPFNVLLIGSDSRSGLTGGQYGSASSVTGQRSDVVKILHVVPATGQIRVLSIPRDTVVAIAGDTTDFGHYNRINATYNAGPSQLVQTIENNFGIPIEHVVQIDFGGFQSAVDAVGGINLDFTYPARDYYSGLDVGAGCQHLDGNQALAVARSRHYQYYEGGYWQYDGTSDFGRIQRQNAFLKALINQAEGKYNPLTLNAFISSVAHGVTIDSSFKVSDLVNLAGQFHKFASSSLETQTLPTYSQASSTFAGLGDVLYVQEPEANSVITTFLGGPPGVATTPPPDPYGSPVSVGASGTTGSSGATATTVAGATGTAPTTTTTAPPPDFDPTPC